MRITKLIAALALALAAAPVTAHADGVQGKWSMTFAGGGDFQAGGTVHQGGSGTVLSLPTRVEEKSFGDIYDAGYRVSFGIGYGVAERLEIIGNVNLGKSSAKGAVNVGDVAGLDLLGDFKEYKDLGVEGGLRLHLAPDAMVKPYLNLVGGVRRVDAIAPTFSVPAANVVLRDVGFYDDSTVPTFGGDFGLGVGLGANAVIGVQAGLRWSGALKQVEGLAGTGLENLNDEGARLSVPLLGTLTLRF
jgi:hypothetical protein